MSLEAKVLRFISEESLLVEQKRLLVAVSGGPDSVCLIYALFRLQEALGVSLHIAHLNHNLRGAESDEDAEYVAQLAKQLGISVVIHSCDVNAYRTEKRISLEEAAREVRYNFLADAAAACGAGCVAVGHTADDQVETTLMHLIRGSGTLGARGLQPLSRWQSADKAVTVIRPLLGVTRAETEGYCEQFNLQPRQDTSNLSLGPFRNKIRQQLVPLLETYNPRVKDAILRMAQLSADDAQFLAEETQKAATGIVGRNGKTAMFSAGEFLKLQPSLQRQMIRAEIEALLGDLKNIELRHIEDIRGAARKKAGTALSLPRGLSFVKLYEGFLLTTEPDGACPYHRLEDSVVLNVPGETIAGGWRITSEIIRPADMAEDDDEWTALLNAEYASESLLVRARRPADRFQPLGMAQSKELTEFMIDAKIPRGWRSRIPLVCSKERILWVTGWRISELAKVREADKAVLRLKFSPLA